MNSLRTTFLAAAVFLWTIVFGAEVAAELGDTPGIALQHAGLLDVLVIFNLGLLLAGTLLHQHLFAKLQGVLSLIFTVVLLIVTVLMLFTAVQLVLLMLGLLLGMPLLYLAVWGTMFTSGTAEGVLTLVFALKIVASVLVALSQTQFLRMKGLMTMLGLSLVMTIVLSFLHGEVPGLLVPITDGVGAIVAAVLTLVLVIPQVFGSIGSFLKSVRV